MSNSEAPPLWEYVPARQYTVPEDTVEETVRRGLAGIWASLRPKQSEPDESQVQVEDALQLASERLLEQAAPAPNWQDSAAALHKTLESWLKTDPPQPPAAFVVISPKSGQEMALTQWAQSQNWREIAPPTVEQILAQDDTWLENFTAVDTPWILPHLERCYLRHVHGLTLVRRFFNQLWSGRLGRGVVGCDSWAWGYLSHVSTSEPPLVLTLQAFDSGRLARWFQDLSTSVNEAGFLFRQADNGKYVLPKPSESGNESDSSDAGDSNFLRHLAARSRGIPRLSWLFWRHTLQTVSDDNVSEEVRESAESSKATLWVLPWQKVKWPSLPSNAGQAHALLLHTLLLHNGLPADLLGRLTPLSATDVQRTLFVLRSADLVTEAENVWQISALGYPAVRRFIDGKGYLIDGV